MTKWLIAIPVVITYYGVSRFRKTLKQYSESMSNLQPEAEEIYVPCQCGQITDDRVHTENVCYPKREGIEDES